MRSVGYTVKSWLIAACMLWVGCAGASVPIAVNEAKYIKIGGIDQWVQIRGADENNPVLLWLNGGPGDSIIPNTSIFKPWEKYFTIAMWDQRGEGRTFEKYRTANASTLTIDRMSEDGVEVAEYLHQRFPNSKVILLGHSWGSVLGIHMIKLRPELFAAYVGTGQVTSLPRQFEAAYPIMLQRAAVVGNKQAAAELTAAGPPVVTNPQAIDVLNKWMWELDPPEHPSIYPQQAEETDDTLSYIDEGADFSHMMLDAALDKEDVRDQGTDFKVPVFLFQGDYDFVTTTSEVKTYFDEITAPIKRLVVFEDSGHNVIFTSRDEFLNQLIKETRLLGTK